MATRTLLTVALLALAVMAKQKKPTPKKPVETDMHRVKSANQVRSEKRDWVGEAQRQLRMNLARDLNVNVAKNVILFIGDGMGPATVTAARFYNAQSRNLPLEDASLAWELFPDLALSMTYNVDRMTADSAGTATAYLCGIKSKFGTLGANENIVYNECLSISNNAVSSIVDHSQLKGKWTGIVTTTRVTHATPAGAYASTANRDWEGGIPADITDGHRCRDIAVQLVEDHADIRVIMGGGKQMFLPIDPKKAGAGKRTDKRNLIEEWKTLKGKSGLASAQYAVLETKDDLDNAKLDILEHVLGLFSDSHMDYESDRISRPHPTQPSLAEMTESAIRILRRGPKGFFLLVEGGRIDHAHHRNNAHRALNETVALSDAVRRAVELTDELDTLIVVTADHSHVMTMGGYPTIDNPILGLINASMPVKDGKPSTTLMYANGPGYNFHRMKDGEHVARKDLTNVDTAAIDFTQDAAMPLDDETHGGEDVAVYARGPMSHLFRGVVEQNYIPHALMYASCVGDNLGHCPADKSMLRAGCSTAARPGRAAWRPTLALAVLATLAGRAASILVLAA